MEFFFYRIGDQIFSKRVPIKFQLWDFFRINDMKSILKSDIFTKKKQGVLLQGNFDREIPDLQNNSGKSISFLILKEMYFNNYTFQFLAFFEFSFSSLITRKTNYIFFLKQTAHNKFEIMGCEEDSAMCSLFWMYIQSKYPAEN